MAGKDIESLGDIEGLSDQELVDRWKKKRQTKRQEIIRDAPAVLERYKKAHEKVWVKWAREFGEESYILGTGTVSFAGKEYPRMRKNPGSKAHPFIPKRRDAYHRKRWKLLKKVQRGKAEEPDIVGLEPTEQIREEIEKTMEETGVPF